MATIIHGGELAREIAHKIFSALKDKGLEAEVVSMADFKKLKLGEVPRVAVFVVQVTMQSHTFASFGCSWKAGGRRVQH